MKERNGLRLVVAALVLLLGMPTVAAAQYFGRNKVQYRSFDFKILQTERFDIYYYPEEIEAAHIVSRMAERWHARLSRLFGHDLRGRQTIVLYASAAHFRQTNTIDGTIGEGTGGVTEALKRRVVLPMSGSLADTDHVLGHELVHAFQFDMTGDDPRDRTMQMPGILAFPLWYAEGMAEYLSLGPVDAQTSMWMRDAALRETLPHLRDLDHPDYFPYRWGHAFWAYIGAKYGDRAVASLIRSAANPRVDLEGLAGQLGSDPDTLTAEWHAAILAKTRALADDASPVASVLHHVIGRENGGGRYNVGPRVSPDGRMVAFFSEHDRFSVDLFLADAETGRIIRRLTTSTHDPHFDSLQFLNSAGAWSPDGHTLAITGIRSGRPVLAMIQASNGRIRREIKLRDLDDAMHPSFSPDGTSVVVSGNRGGLIDLYRVQISDGHIERLTSDAYADLEAVFTPDGRGLVFVTERFSTDLERLEPGPARLAYLDLSSRAVRAIPGFLQGRHLSPQVTPEGRHVIFVADPDGVNNLYRMSIDGGPAERLSSVATGIAGITASSPTLSMAADGRLVFSVFEHDGHSVYRLDPEDTMALVPPLATVEAAVLPGRSVAGGDVYALLEDPDRGLPSVGPVTEGEPYRRKLALDFLSQPTVSGGVSSLGARVVGGMSATFSDTLGDRSLGAEAYIGGTLADFGGQVLYINRQHRWNWSAAVAAVPTSVGYVTRIDNLDTGGTQINAIIERQHARGVYVSALRPFSSTTRLEVSASAEALAFSRETRTDFYDSDGYNVDQTSRTVPLGPNLYLGYASVALVRDTSIYGASHPIFGDRARLEVGRTTGSVEYVNVLADWRRYFMPRRPWTVAVRGLHYGRYGRDSGDELLIDYYTGYPEFVHGYSIGTYSSTECLGVTTGAECDGFENQLGTRMLVANVEVRVPIPGLFSGEVQYGRLPVDVAFFADAGLAWTANDRPTFAGGSRQLVRSFGTAVRINVFGIVPLELAVSRPLDRIDRKLRFQIGIRQGF
jgi:hypothetical protein